MSDQKENTGDRNSISPDDCLIFNKPSFDDWNAAQNPDWMLISATQWICESDMTDKEKDAYRWFFKSSCN